MQRTTTLLRVFAIVAVSVSPPLLYRSRHRQRCGYLLVLGYQSTLPPSSSFASPAGCRVPCAGDRHATSRGRGPATNGVWIGASRGWRILWASVSPLETPSPPLAPLVMNRACILSFLVVRTRKDGYISDEPPHLSRLSHAKPLRQSWQ